MPLRAQDGLGEAGRPLLYILERLPGQPLFPLLPFFGHLSILVILCVHGLGYTSPENTEGTAKGFDDSLRPFPSGPASLHLTTSVSWIHCLPAALSCVFSDCDHGSWDYWKRLLSFWSS